MMIPVRWFFYVPCVVNGSLAMALGCSAGRAAASGDFARALAVFGATLLFAASTIACGMVAEGNK